MKEKKIIKKDQTIITPEMAEKCPTKTVLEKTITMNRTAKETYAAFGIPQHRVVEILKKLIAVARIYPRYSVISEVMLNCSDRFTEMERLFGLFILGKVKGMATLMQSLNLKVKYDANLMNPEQKLLSLLSKRVIVVDPLLNKLLERG